MFFYYFLRDALTIFYQKQTSCINENTFTAKSPRDISNFKPNCGFTEHPFFACIIH